MMELRQRLSPLVLLLLITVGLILLDQSGNFDRPQEIGQTLLAPAERWLTGTYGAVDDVVYTVQNLATLRSENEDLRKQLEELSLVRVQLVETEKENRRLRELLDFKRDNPNFTLLVAQVVAQEEPATVISVDPSNLVQAVRIDQGSTDGIKMGMPVVNARGLVGRITDVGENWAIVSLIIDESSAVTALDQQSRASGVVEGTGTGLIMRFIEHDQSVEVGDVILTSGLGEEFPKGLVIGTVQDVNQREVDPYQEAVIEPPIDFNSLEYLFVVRAFQPTIPEPEETATPSASE